MRGDPLGEAEAEIARLQGLLQAARAEVRRSETFAKHWSSKYEQQRRRCAVLAAAADMRAGRISKIASHSMWDKEAGILAVMFGRWECVDDLPELCVRALHKVKGGDGERMSARLAELPNAGPAA